MQKDVTAHLLNTSLKMLFQHLQFHGPLVLIDTDDLNGRTLTGVLNVRKDLSNAGAQVVDESVVVDNNIVTSRTPDDLDDFNREIVKQLEA